jgi:hypothetical protein
MSNQTTALTLFRHEVSPYVPFDLYGTCPRVEDPYGTLRRVGLFLFLFFFLSWVSGMFTVWRRNSVNFVCYLLDLEPEPEPMTELEKSWETFG